MNYCRRKVTPNWDLDSFEGLWRSLLRHTRIKEGTTQLCGGAICGRLCRDSESERKLNGNSSKKELVPALLEQLRVMTSSSRPGSAHKPAEVSSRAFVCVCVCAGESLVVGPALTRFEPYLVPQRGLSALLASRDKESGPGRR